MMLRRDQASPVRRSLPEQTLYRGWPPLRGVVAAVSMVIHSWAMARRLRLTIIFPWAASSPPTHPPPPDPHPPVSAAAWRSIYLTLVPAPGVPPIKMASVFRHAPHPAPPLCATCT